MTGVNKGESEGGKGLDKRNYNGPEGDIFRWALGVREIPYVKRYIDKAFKEPFSWYLVLARSRVVGKPLDIVALHVCDGV